MQVTKTKQQLITEIYILRDELKEHHNVSFIISLVGEDKKKIDFDKLRKWIEQTYPAALTVSRKKEKFCFRAGISKVLNDHKIDYSNVSFKSIGKLFRLHHSTIIHAVGVANNLVSDAGGYGDIEGKVKIENAIEVFMPLFKSGYFDVNGECISVK